MIEKNKGHIAGSAQVSSEQVKRCYTAFFLCSLKKIFLIFLHRFSTLIH